MRQLLVGIGLCLVIGLSACSDDGAPSIGGNEPPASDGSALELGTDADVESQTGAGGVASQGTPSESTTDAVWNPYTPDDEDPTEATEVMTALSGGSLVPAYKSGQCTNTNDGELALDFSMRFGTGLLLGRPISSFADIEEFRVALETFQTTPFLMLAPIVVMARLCSAQDAECLAMQLQDIRGEGLTAGCAACVARHLPDLEATCTQVCNGTIADNRCHETAEFQACFLGASLERHRPLDTRIAQQAEQIRREYRLCQGDIRGYLENDFMVERFEASDTRLDRLFDRAEGGTERRSERRRAD